MITIQKDHNNNNNDQTYEWDYLVFTQQWPNTQCKIWKKRRNSCRFPRNRDLWTVHGIWANKYGGQWVTECDGPSFNSLDVASLNSELSENWVNVNYPHPNQDFWSMEWNRHGTCVLDHPELNTQKKYFQKAMEWSHNYNMKDILSRAGVHPDSRMGVRLSQIYNGVRNELGVSPTIRCMYNSNYLHEIRICFDRNLNLIDCEEGGNCPQKVIYPGSSTSL